jgi:hypothetical protein
MKDSIVRAFLTAACAALVLPAIALADPSTSPGYTAADQAQFARLEAANGKWTCTDTPPSKAPDVFTGKQAGNWYLWTETGDGPSTTYVRWNHALQAYTQIEIDQSGSVEVYTTKSRDPFAGTWRPIFPPNSGLYPFVYSHSAGTMTSTGKFKDRKTGQVILFTGVCTKS